MNSSPDMTPRPDEPAPSPAPADPAFMACADQRQRHRRARKALFGLSVAGLGGLALADSLQGSGHALLGTWWPLALVLWGTGRLLWPSPWAAAASRVGGLVLMGAGAAMTAYNAGQGALSVHQWWPVLVILGGVAVLLRGLLPRQRPDVELWRRQHADITGLAEQAGWGRRGCTHLRGHRHARASCTC